MITLLETEDPPPWMLFGWNSPVVLVEMRWK